MPVPLPAQLGRATFGAMLRATIQGIPVNPDAAEADIAEDREAAVITLTSLRPRDPIEAMLAARIVASNFAAMECYRRSGLADVADDVMLRLHTKAIALSNLATRLLRELRELRAEPAATAAPREPRADTKPASETAASQPPASITVSATRPQPAGDRVAHDVAARALQTTARLPTLAA